jgi:predicted metal-dependent HD superfamily phosphohydrolase
MPTIESWQAMWKGLGVDAGDEALYRELIDKYSEAHRKYHTVRHLDECLDGLNEIRSLAVHAHEIEIALWFHDAIYDVTRHDNEERSAAWIQNAALSRGLPVEVANRLHALVMVTKHNAIPTDTDSKLLVDIDLSILGAEPARFDEYERQIRAEYAWVEEELFRTERRRILEQLIARPRLFNSEHFFLRCESQARSNLQRSLDALAH